MTVAIADGSYKPTVLIVDDIPNNLGILVESLESLESACRLVVAQDGHEGLKRAALVKPDLILLDVMMPGMDGFEVCRRLKQNPDTADIPVIFLTTLTETEHKVAGFKVGGVDYLTKPMQIDEVIARVGAHLNLRAMRRQLEQQNLQLQRQQAELEQRVAQLSASNRLLREEIAERERVDNTLKFIAQRNWVAGGQVFLSELVRYLGRLLAVDYVLVDKLAADPDHAETVALYAHGNILPNLQYGLKHTPCDNVMAGGLCCYTEQVQQRFPDDTLLADMQVESYIGLPLWDSTGQVIGLIAVMDSRPIADERAIVSLLQLVATSAAAELERRRSEQRLEESRQFLSRIIETIPDPVFVKDRQHRWVLINPAFCEFMGYPQQDLLGKSYDDIFPKDTADRFRAQAEAVFDSGEERIDENELTGRDGKIHTVVTKKIRYVDERGDAYLVGILQDISVRKGMEAALSSQANLQQTLLNAIADAGMQLMIIENGRIIHVGNRKLAYAFGYNDEDIAAQPALASLIHPDDRARIMDIHARRLAGEPTASSYELTLVTRDGERREYEASVALVPDTDPVRIVTIGKDITERKTAQHRMELLDRAIDLSSDAIFLIDEQFRFNYVNATACRTLGYHREELLTMTPLDIDPDVTPDFLRTCRQDTAVGITNIFETRHRRKDGSVFPVEISVAGFVDDGAPFMLAVVRDITERKRAEAENRRLIAILEESADFIGSADTQGKLLYHNRAARRMIGLPDDADLSALHVSDIHTDWGMKRLLETGIPAVLEHGLWRGDNALRHRDGSEIPVAQLVMLHRDAEGRPEFTSAIMHDLTERKRTEDVLKFIAQGAWMQSGEEFLIALTRFLSQMLAVDYVAINKLTAEPGYVETVAIYGKDAVIPNTRYPLQDTPCEKVLSGSLCCYPADVRRQFPNAALLDDMQIDSYAGLPLWDSTGRLIGLIAVLDGKPFADSAAITSILQLAASSAAAELARRQSAQALAESRRFLGQIIDAIPDPVFVKDRAHRWIHLNQAYCDLMGHPMTALLGKSDFDFFQAHEAQVFWAKNELVFDSGQESLSEEELTDSRGVTHTIQTRKTRYIDDNGQHYLVGVIRDISQRKQSENLLHQRERELRTLVENLPTMVVRYDRSFRRVYVNHAYSLITGRTESEILGLSAVDAWRATNISADAYLDILDDVMRSGKKTEVTLQWVDTDSRLISHAIKIVPEFGADGRVNSVLALGFDLSDRHHRHIIESERQRVFEKMAHGEPLDSILEQVALYAESSKIGGYCCILLLDENGHYQQMVATPSFPNSYRNRRNPLSLLKDERGHCHGWIESALRRERIILEDINRHPCWAICQGFIGEINALACWSEPIFSSTRQLLGVLTLYSNQAGAPDDDELALLQQASHLSSIAIERKRIEQQMHRQASYDTLTGLPNRRLFNNRLREEIVRAERGAYNVAVLFIDLDHFKEVNDTLGHEFGDRLLVDAAQRIRACIRESDTVARLGGDEFVIALAEVGDIIPQSRVAQNIVETLAQPFQLDDHHAYVSASIGIASYPQDADNAETLIGCADQAMYAAKDIGRNSFSFFTPGMREQARQRLQLAADLRGALGLAQLEVYCQPVIEIGSGRLAKAEALLRWRHPERGMVPPDQFIPIAEETDLIQEIGAWVFREAAVIAQRWNALRPNDGLRQISVNVSPRQFVRGNPEAYCIDYLQAIGLNPGAIVIEITEGLLLDDQAGVMDKLRRFHELGIQLALDDFGTGYSAMAYLKKFNIDYLKIDRSFVRDLETDPGDRAIAEAIVAMAHRLGLKVIAEGVETEGQRDLLAAVGCEYVQGYLYAKPMPVEAFLEYAASHAAALNGGQ